MLTLDITECSAPEEFTELWHSAVFRARRELEGHIAESAAQKDFSLPGWCRVDNQPVDFHCKWPWPEQDYRGIIAPNWRENLFCPLCGLNNRQRAIAGELLARAHSFREAGARPCRLYCMEQTTKFFDTVSTIEGIECVGSEYLGAELEGGDSVGGIRHEDAEALSFADDSFDLVSSNEVFEHLDQPEAAWREAQRVLAPGGELLFTVPFNASAEHNFPRARREGDKVVHLAEPVYHGNPLATEGSLVFTDFGWEMLTGLEAAGFERCTLQSFWSFELGHLGGSLVFFRALNGGA